MKIQDVTHVTLVTYIIYATLMMQIVSVSSGFRRLNANTYEINFYRHSKVFRMRHVQVSSTSKCTSSLLFHDLNDIFIIHHMIDSHSLRAVFRTGAPN